MIKLSGADLGGNDYDDSNNNHLDVIELVFEDKTLLYRIDKELNVAVFIGYK